MPKRLSLTQIEINTIPESTWYRYIIECGHKVYTKVRIKVPDGYSFMENYIRCPTCEQLGNIPTAWQPIVGMKAVSDDLVRDVSEWTAFILPNRIMRTQSGSPSGSPFPYVSSTRDY